MKVKGQIILLSVTILIYIALAAITGVSGLGEEGRVMTINMLEKKVETHLKLANHYSEEILNRVVADEFEIDYFKSESFKNGKKFNITLLIYENNRLIHWSDNGFDIPPDLTTKITDGKVIELQNGNFVPKISKSGNFTVVALARVTFNYEVENDILKSGFVKSLKVPNGVQFSLSEADNSYRIVDSYGNTIFCVTFSEEDNDNLLTRLSLVFILTTFFFLIILIVNISKINRDKNTGWVRWGICSFCLLVLYLILLYFRRITGLYFDELSSSLSFSFGQFIPSLGHLFILCFNVFITVIIFYQNVTPATEKNKFSNLYSLFFLIGTLLLCIAHLLFRKILSETGINLDFSQMLAIKISDLIALLSVTLLIFASLLMFIKTFKAGLSLFSSRIIIPLILTAAIVTILFRHDTWSLCIISTMLIGQIILAKIIAAQYLGNFFAAILYALLTSAYILNVASTLNVKRTDEELKIQALSFSVENDIEAELLLLDIGSQLDKDEMLNEIMGVPYFTNQDYMIISNYLSTNYFNDYWQNYSISIYLCEEWQSLQVGGSEGVENCFDFFERRISEHGQRVGDTDFFFIDDMSGRTCYFGNFYFNNRFSGRNGLFIELYSDMGSLESGYSELLLDKKYNRFSELYKYSFAKYIDGRLVLAHGDYDYYSSDNVYIGDSNADYQIFEENALRHVLYRNGNSTIIISREALNIRNMMMSFAYILVFILLFFNILVLLVNGIHLSKIVSLNLRQRFQFGISFIILISSILFGILVVNMLINRNEQKHLENIRANLNSISLILDSQSPNVENYFHIPWEANVLNNTLVDISNMFTTDVNIFSLNGELIATSRPEIFSRNLISTRMEETALYQLGHLSKITFIQTETIGNMQYYSVYAPILDSYGRTIAYLNLPYFRLQSRFSEENTDMIIAVSNFTLLLILISLTLAVLIIGRLTSPLTMLSQGLAAVKLNKRVDHISYNYNDEIGDLIKQYNLMVDELDESTIKLANSEREFAWREMAKQIAHEIKNPLTPMKLNVQQLYKSYRDCVPDFDHRIEKFSKNQVEYIDNLSSIATAFSSFAKMPLSKPVRLNLAEQIRVTIGLFADTKNITISHEWNNLSDVMVFVDGEHFNGIFSNLIKNAIQSIPPDRKGAIVVALQREGNNILVKIIDNGCGIPPEIGDKLFTPNFTTKTSGAGLGLSIVKRYVENAGGTIYFESVPEQGSTFVVSFPIVD